MQVLTVRDADAMDRLWTDLEGREEVLLEKQADQTAAAAVMEWLADCNTTPLCLPIPSPAIAAELLASIESLNQWSDAGADGITVSGNPCSV
jgi:hypothetical protein